LKVREDQPVFSDGTVDLNAWLERVKSKATIVDEEQLLRACRIARTAEQEADHRANDWGEDASAFKTGLEMAEILADLSLDQDAIVAGILYRTVREEELELDTVRDQFGPKVATLINGVARMAAIHRQQKSTKSSVLGQTETQGEAVRKMLVAMIDDVRVALIKLAERTCAIRAVKNAPVARRYKVAREVFDIYAPLAHRLGVGHLKWELEDLAFRYLEPQDYKKIAQLLDEKRLDRQVYIEKVQSLITEQIEAADIHKAQIQGRAKHIYSIWRKMKRKNISFSQVYDIRAFRILVPAVRDCYSVLGIVHSLWRHIPREFDDYIASPKQNGYRSLHTAVIGPEGKVVEIQIRTADMHEDAELGVCAHWLYKGTDAKRSQSRGYEEKVAWLRQVLEWHDELGGIDEMVEELGAEVTVDRIYVLTPEGHVVDLSANATPIDFAYKVHTDIGHRCRGAKVNGRIVPLNTPLSIGDQIEILTGNEATPSRDWLNADLGFVRSSRTRAKIKHWFKSQDRDINISDGKDMLVRELRRFNIDKIDMKQLAQLVNFHSDDDLFAALGAGDVRLMHVVHHAEDMVNPPKVKAINLAVPKKQNHSSDLVIHGVGNLLTTIANCCKPVPGDTVEGFITVGRGVSIHRDDCSNLLQLKSIEPERILDVSWGGEVRTTYPVELLVVAYDRTGLLKDMMTVLANIGVNIISMNSLSNKADNTVEMRLTVEVEDLHGLGRVMALLSKVANVADVRRVYPKIH
jgi:GTP pyrophosphokinase